MPVASGFVRHVSQRLTSSQAEGKEETTPKNNGYPTKYRRIRVYIDTEGLYVDDLSCINGIRHEAQDYHTKQEVGHYTYWFGAVEWGLYTQCTTIGLTSIPAWRKTLRAGTTPGFRGLKSLPHKYTKL